jgi:hypothetical protein
MRPRQAFSGLHQRGSRRAVKEGIFTYASDWQAADFIRIVMPSVSAPKMQCCGYRNLFIQMMVQRR